MSSFLSRIQEVRQPAEALAQPLDVRSAATEPEPAAAEPEAPSPTLAPSESVSYLLNPPLPSRAAPAPDIQEASAPDVEIPRWTPPLPVSRVTVSRPRRTKKQFKTLRTEVVTMKKTPAPVRVTVTPKPTAAVHARAPDPEGSLAWLQFLAKNVHPGALHLLLSYYRRLGWIPAGSYGWLRDLCDGIARQARTLTWESLRIGPDRLVKIHAQSYRWLSAMFPNKEPVAHASNGNGAVLVRKVARGH